MYILGRALPATNPSSATAFTARPKRAASFFVRSPFVVFVKSVALLTSVIQKNSSRPGIPGQGSKSSALPAAPVDIKPNVIFENSSPHKNRYCERHHQAARTRNLSTAHNRQRTRLCKACHDDHETRHRRHRTHHFACELHHLCQIRRITTQSCCYRRSNRHQPVFATAAKRRRLRRSSLRSMTPVSSQHFRHRSRQSTVFLQPQPPGIQKPARRRISHAGSHQT